MLLLLVGASVFMYTCEHHLMYPMLWTDYIQDVHTLWHASTCVRGRLAVLS
jgi:hypothetical protein